MGNNHSKRDPKSKALSESIDSALKVSHYQDTDIIRLLLLGAGESGKSTLFKQMIKLYGSGFTQKDYQLYIPMVRNNIIQAIKELAFQSKQLNLPECVFSEEVSESVKVILDDLKVDMTLTPEIAEHIKKIWADEGIKNTFKHRAQFQLMDTADYFFENIDRIASEEYTPSDQDLILCRVRTTGIVEHDFNIQDNNFRIIDVGGQRNERKKWIHCFEGVTAVIFVVAISEYDQTLYEDGTTNRMDEALKLFSDTIQLQWFAKTSFILFLNKRDLFQSKIEEKIPLSMWDKEYTGDNTYDDALNHIRNKFESVTKQQVYPHVTCATDSNNVSVVFGAVKEIVIRKHLVDSGLA